MNWPNWKGDIAIALAGLVGFVVAFYVIGLLMMGVQIALCDDQCEADRLAAEGRML